MKSRFPWSSSHHPKRWVIGAIAAVGLLVMLYQGVNSRAFQAFGKVVTTVPCDGKYIALTLDDGPTPDGTDQLLSLLERHHARATFFLVGDDLERFPEAGVASRERGTRSATIRTPIRG